MKRRLATLLDKVGLMPLTAFALDVARFSAGVPVYVLKGATPSFAYQGMVGLYCFTRGYSNDFISRFIGAANPRYRLASRVGILGRLDDARLRDIVRDLRTNGYHVFDEKLAPELCDRLMEIALETTCSVRAMDSDPAPPARVLYDRESPVGIRYDYHPSDLIRHVEVQDLMSDASMLAIAQEYLGSAPVLDIVAMWWHTAFSRKPDKTAAQYYHFDMDRVKWLKFFILLTDVSPSTGPHCFVPGSHRRGKTPRALLKRGYARLTDSEVREQFPNTDIVEFTGPRGTIIAEDTRGLHKGKHVQKGDRLMFELEFANSTFGADLPDDRLPHFSSEKLAAMARRYPRVYRLFLPKTGS